MYFDSIWHIPPTDNSFIAVFLFYNEQKKGRFILFVFMMFIACSAFFLQTHVALLNSRLFGFNYLNESISELGGKSGFSLFFLIIGLSGLILKYKERIARYAYVLIMWFVLLGIFIDPDFNVVLCFVLAPLSAVAFLEVIKRRWELDIIKNLVVILIICGLLFSSVAYSKRLVTSKPDYTLIQSLGWFSVNSRNEGYVFSHYSNGFLIQSIGKRNVLFDPFSIKNEYSEKTYNETLQIFYSRNLKVTKNLLNKYLIKYIFIDEDMKQGLVWQDADEGLLFLFNNNQTFEKIYGMAGVEIWEYHSGNETFIS